MHKPTHLIVFVISIFLMSCTSIKPSITASPTNLQQEDVPYPSPTIDGTKVAPTVSPQSPSKTPFPSSTATHTPTATFTPVPTTAKVIQQCYIANDWSPNDFLIEGALIYRCENGACSLKSNEQELVKTTITPTNPNLLLSRIAISPDGKWFAYEEITQEAGSNTIQSRRLRILSENGQEIPVTHWEPDWRLKGWQDNNTLILELESELHPDYQVWTGDDPHTMILFNPFVENIEEILLPSLDNPYRGDLLLKGPQENYDPTFERVAYLYVDATSGYVHFALWDVHEDKLLWQRMSGNEQLFGTHWAPDGQWLAVASEIDKVKTELFLVDRNGKEKQATNLLAAYPGMNVSIGNFSWSPDGRFISLWLNIRPGEFYETWRFAVLNVESGELVDYCFKSSADQFPYAIWSPNSQQIAVQSYESDHLASRNLIVIDILKGEARRLPSEGFLWSWMTSEP